MTCKIDAVFENGLFRPLHPLEGLREHAHVHLTVESTDLDHGSIAECVGTLPDEDAEEMRRIIAREFEQVDLRDW